MISDSSDQETEIKWSPQAIDYKKMEEKEKELYDEKKHNPVKNVTKDEQVTFNDNGVYL